MGFFTPRRCDVACTCDPCICEIRLGMVPRPGSSCFVNFTTELIRRCEGAATQLDPDAYGIWLRFDSTAFGTDYFLHYEGPMADFRGIFDNFRPTINRDYVLTAYQIEGEFSDAICPDPIEEVAVSYTEERSCDICEEDPVQRICECDGGTPLPNAIVTVAGSPTTQPLVSAGTSDDYCDPYPGFGIFDPITGLTLYNPLNPCASLAGVYVAPCTFDGVGSTSLVWYIFNRVCDGKDADNTFYVQQIIIDHGPGACEVIINSGIVQTDVDFPEDTLMTSSEVFDLEPGFNFSSPDQLRASNMPSDVDCFPIPVIIKTCSFASDGYLRQESPGISVGGRCGPFGYDVSITR